MTTPALFDDLKRDEGLRLTAYKDTVGIWTVGYGHAHVAPGTVWTQDQADQALADDVNEAENDLDDNIPWWTDLDDVRQDVLVEMCFNMGIGRAPTATEKGKGLLGFPRTLAAVQTGDYATASADMLMSRWATQVGERATRLAAMMKTGERADG